MKDELLNRRLGYNKTMCRLSFVKLSYVKLSFRILFCKKRSSANLWILLYHSFWFREYSFDNDEKVKSEQGEHEEQDLDEVEEEEDLAGQQTGEQEDEDEDKEKEKDTDKEPVENPDSE